MNIISATERNKQTYLSYRQGGRYESSLSGLTQHITTMAIQSRATDQAVIRVITKIMAQGLPQNSICALNVRNKQELANPLYR
jgi:hypothetical protein